MWMLLLMLFCRFSIDYGLIFKKHVLGIGETRRALISNGSYDDLALLHKQSLSHDLVFKLMLGRHSENLLDLEKFTQIGLVRGLAYHDIAGFIVGTSILDHVWTSMDPGETIDSQIVHKEQHETLIVQEMLQALQRELVKIVVNADDLDFDHGVVF